ncbi:Ivy family c-type lysozyme inhibitor [Brevundimonas sp. 374]|uniref:Ivy family c-type lysozyme inhibitor n=1 Tax=Brevundimonas sp. 374 TaxID=1150400 RepID=UPI0008807A11|nr:Inhibitor of vertebrate lysozyme (Ivy) [Brevundimonas sp. 374]
MLQAMQATPLQLIGESAVRKYLIIGTAAFLANCDQAPEVSTVAALLRDGLPAACSHQATMAALTSETSKYKGTVSSITFAGRDASLSQVTCDATIGDVSITYQVRENLALPGTVTVIVNHPPASPVSSPANSAPPALQPRPTLVSARGYTFNVPTNYPAAYSLWRQQTASLPIQGRPWVRSLSGTAAEVRNVRVNGDEYLYGWVCEPHNCGGNEAALLLTRDQGRVIGLVRLTNERREINDYQVGTPTGPETRCLQFFLEDRSDATTCF